MRRHEEEYWKIRVCAMWTHKKGYFKKEVNNYKNQLLQNWSNEKQLLYQFYRGYGRLKLSSGVSDKQLPSE